MVGSEEQRGRWLGVALEGERFGVDLVLNAANPERAFSLSVMR